jgi:hypothetical protein
MAHPEALVTHPDVVGAYPGTVDCGGLLLAIKDFRIITYPCKCYVYIQYVHFSMSKVISQSQKKLIT